MTTHLTLAATTIMFLTACNSSGTASTTNRNSSVITVAVNDATITENATATGSQTATITVQASSKLTSALTINYATADGTATSTGQLPDYTAANGTLTIPVGQTQATFDVPISGALWNDATSKTVNLALSGGSGYSATGSKLTGTLTLKNGATYTTTLPLPSYNLANDDTVTHACAVGSLGEDRTDYGYDTTNAGLRGHYRFDSVTGSLIFERTPIAGDAWADYNFLPDGNQALLHRQLKSIAHVGVTIQAQLNVDAPTLATACGIIFGFGDTIGHPNAANLGASLRLHNRDWSLATNSNKTQRDYFRFGYETHPQGQKLTIDAPINSYNAASDWDNFTAAQWLETNNEFAVMKNTYLTHAGDTITYREDIYLNLPRNQVVVTITPLSSNVDMTGWSAQTVVWDPTQPVGTTTAAGSLRGGLDLTNVTGAASMTMAQLNEEYVNIGFVANMSPRLCQFSNLQIDSPQ